MVGAYLRIASLCSEDSSELVSSLGTFLLSIYNLICGAMENMNCTSLFSENGIEIPDISHSSIYHDSMVVSNFFAVIFLYTLLQSANKRVNLALFFKNLSSKNKLVDENGSSKIN